MKSEDVILQEQNLITKQETWQTINDGIDGNEYLDQTSQSCKISLYVFLNSIF